MEHRKVFHLARCISITVNLIDSCIQYVRECVSVLSSSQVTSKIQDAPNKLNVGQIIHTVGPRLMRRLDS